MKLKAIHLQHFRCFSDFNITFDEQLTVLVARNGMGKTSILDAAAILLGSFLTHLPNVSGLSFKKTDFQLLNAEGAKPPFMRLRATTHNHLSWDRTEKRDNSKATSKAIPIAEGMKALHNYVDTFIDAENKQAPLELPVFIYYGAGRGVFDVPQRKRGFGKNFKRFDALIGALESRTNFRRFVEYFYALEDRETRLQKDERSFDVEIPELKTIRKAVSTLLPEFSNPRSADAAGIQLDWSPASQDKKTLRIDQFSDGFRTTLAMVMDIAARMAEANPHLEDALQSEGIVMIDEVELHLHPGWQQTILLGLMRTFPNVQFIVSTHSPQVVSAVESECLRVIDWSEGEPRLLPITFSKGAEAQQVLLDVLGVASPRVEDLDIVKSLRRYQEFVEKNQWDSDEAKKLRGQLDHWGGEHEPELKTANLRYDALKWRA